MRKRFISKELLTLPHPNARPSAQPSRRTARATGGCEYGDMRSQVGHNCRLHLAMTGASVRDSFGGHTVRTPALAP